MKQFHLIILIITYLPLANGQYTFNTIISKNTNAFSFPISSICEDSENNYYAIGIDYPDGVINKTRLIKLNSFGIKVLDTTYYTTPDREFHGEIVPAFDGGVLMAHQSLSYPADDEDDSEDILLRKIDVNGNLQWQKVLPARTFRDMIVTSDSCYLVSGEAHELDGLFGSDIIVYKVDRTGEVLWVNRFGLPSKVWPEPWEQEWCQSIKNIKYSVFISGFHTSSDNTFTRNGLLLKYDLDGNLLWSIKVYAPNGQDYRINSVFEFDNHYYFARGIVAGIEQYYEFDPATGEYWEVDIFPELKNLDKGNNYFQRCNSGIISAVEIIDTISYFRLYSQLDTFYYEKSIPELNQFGVYEIVGTNDGGYLMLGGSGSSMQILKTDCLGNVEFWSSECDSKIPADNDLIIFPNPTKGEFTVEANFNFREIYIYNMLGQYLRFENQCECNKQKVDISNLSNGTYIIKIRGTNQEEAISRVIKLE